ncbi:MAG: aminotransferase class I/II-fold pyridoxal phosphate-dependent enzyme [Clostridia bacterium]|nr:aminotransferase class I/II-fold pyridoxal phosphate-dependent enzyme [Clostridia bacterium]
MKVTKNQKFDFETLVDRKNIGNLKNMVCSEAVRAAGLLSYNGAEADYRTAPSVIRAMTERVQNGLFGFTLADDAYLDPIVWWMETQRGVKIEKEWIVPTLGMIFSVATAIRLTTEPGEGIIVQPPVYHRYEQAADRLGRRTVYNRLTEKDGVYSMDFEDLEHCMADEHNRLFVLCNPQNPTGNVWDEDTLLRVVELSNKYGVYVISDEIFGEVTFRHRCPMYAVLPGAAKYGISETSLGKTFNFTGENLANLIIPDGELRERFIAQRNADHFGSIDPVLHAAVQGAYCPEGAAWKDAQLEHINGNAEYILAFFREHLPQVRISPFEGSFVLWIDWRALGLDEPELMRFLKGEALFELDEGTHYDSERGSGFTRMNISCPRRELEKSLALLLEAAKKRGWAR